MNMEPRNIPNTMTEEEYDRERERLREIYGDGRSSVEARAKSDMALCKFFITTGWTYERIAKKEGYSQAMISRRLVFGRFLNTYLPTGTYLPKNLTESRFRGYWQQTADKRTACLNRQGTEGFFNESGRFDEVLRLIEEDTSAVQQRRPMIGKSIAENFADDGKWHDVPSIAAKIEAPEDHVKDTLDGISKNKNYNCKCERREFGNVTKFRIFREEKTVGTYELIEKLAPFLKALQLEGKKNMATMSPPTVAFNVAKIQQQIDEWAGKPAKETGLRKVVF